MDKARIENEQGLAFVALQGLLESAMQSNVDALGFEEAFIELNRTFEHNAKWCVINAPITVGKETKGIDGLRNLLCWWNDVVYSPQNFFYGTDNDGSVLLVCTGCKHAGIYPLICEGYCRSELIFMCEESNPDLEMDLEECLSKGDERCLWRIKRKDGSRVVEGSIPYHKTDFPSALIETKAFWSMAGVGEFFTQATAALVQQIGPEKALSQLSKRSSEFGEEFGVYLSLNRDRWRFNGVLELMHFLDDLIQIKGIPFVDGGQIGGTEVSSCPFRDSPIECCKQIETFRNGVARVLFPKEDFRFHEERGENGCRWTLETRPKFELESQKNMPHKGDPLERLTNKMIEGEITEEEFERKLALLKKHDLLK